MQSRALVGLAAIRRQIWETGREALVCVKWNGARWSSAMVEEAKHEEEGELKLTPSAVEVCAVVHWEMLSMASGLRS